VRVASLSTTVPLASMATGPELNITGGSPRIAISGGAPRVKWRANSGCLAARLRAAIHHVARHYGRVRVNSTCRSRRHNRRVGGARRSYHIGRLRDECLNETLFSSLDEARVVLAAWRQDYNRVRPHSSLANRTPEEFRLNHISLAVSTAPGQEFQPRALPMSGWEKGLRSLPLRRLRVTALFRGD
jgi:hypothetical protein